MKKSAAAALIAKTTRQEALPTQARKALAELLEHNDEHPRGQRVSADAAMVMLRDMGLSMGRTKFDRIVKREFGRAWGSK